MPAEEEQDFVDDGEPALDLPPPGSRKFDGELLETVSTACRSDKPERITLPLFKLAYRLNRLDAAEHFLHALETLERHPEVQESKRCRCAVMEAYGQLIRRH
ncbi:hypothetical protein [Mesorhizobium captivum]|uniref:hypothetical protein n=1 Tax=Mesorhizobium captivum TaxID=3072319 RepID=UPI002A240C04|nr:hypothetical protein [Mesorhizobium sp. VK3C]MDX8449413.1 hypothetical protein [Mesorhizobium sp. VK3C]